MLFITASVSLHAQYIVQSFPNAKQNPNGFNRADDVQNPMPGQGWTTIYNESSEIPKWTKAFDLPFPFYLNKIKQTVFKVSNSGVLTFDTAATQLPIAQNITLPSDKIPNSSICLLGLSGESNYASISLPSSARNPMIRTKVFGTTPNRQFWISFTGFSYYFADTTLAALCNWSIMLEESSNFIYVIDQSTFTYAMKQGGFSPDTTNIALTIGLKLQDSLTFMSAESPNEGSKVFNTFIGSTQNFTAQDNAYIVFKHKDAIPIFDMGVHIIGLGNFTAGTNQGITIPCSIVNNGADTIRSFRLRYQLENKSIIDTVYNSLTFAPNSEVQFQSAIWNPGKTELFRGKIWCDSINGNKPDEYSVNDTAYFTTSYMTDPPKKRVLIENITSTGCGECPKTQTAIDTIHKLYPETIAVSYHVENDSMKIGFSETLQELYTLKSPSVMIDRMFSADKGYGAAGISFSGSKNYDKGAPILDKVQALSNQPTPVDFEIYHTFHNPTRKLTATVYSTFHAAYSGDLRFNALLVSDSMKGENQTNAMAGDTTYPVWGTEPTSISKYNHKNVVRHALMDTADTYGSPNTLPFDIAIGGKYSKTYEYIIPNSIDIQSLEIVGFLLDYNPELAGSYVVNAGSRPVRINITHVEESEKQKGLDLFPLPANNSITIQYAAQDRFLTCEIYSALGENILSEKIEHLSSNSFVKNYDISTLPIGVYYFTIADSRGKITQPFIISR